MEYFFRLWRQVEVVPTTARGNLKKVERGSAMFWHVVGSLIITEESSYLGEKRHRLPNSMTSCAAGIYQPLILSLSVRSRLLRQIHQRL